MHKRMTYQLATKINCTSQLKAYIYHNRVTVLLMKVDRLNFAWEWVTLTHELWAYVQGTTNKLVTVFDYTE